MGVTCIKWIGKIHISLFYLLNLRVLWHSFGDAIQAFNIEQNKNTETYMFSSITYYFQELTFNWIEDNLKGGKEKEWKPQEQTRTNNTEVRKEREARLDKMSQKKNNQERKNKNKKTKQQQQKNKDISCSWIDIVVIL